MNCLSYLSLLLLCICFVFSYPEKYIPRSDLYYNAFGIGEWEYDQKLSDCRFNIDRKTVYCEDQKNRLRLAIKVNTNANCGYGDKTLVKAKLWTKNSRDQMVETNNVISRKCVSHNGSDHHHFDFYFSGNKKSCVFNASYACSDVRITKY